MFYGWWMVGLGGFVMTIATVPLFHAMSVWAVAFESQFHWTRTQLGFALAFTRIEGGLMGPVEGYLVDKVGTRRMVMVGMIILGLGFLFFGQVQNLWMFYVAYLLMALGQGLGSWVPIMTLLNNWFQRGRAEVLSGAAKGLSGTIKRDRVDGTGARVIELWEPLRGREMILPGPSVQIDSG